MSDAPGFRLALTTLWLQLTTLAIFALAFCEALFLAQGRAQGWFFYLTAREVAFEVVVRLVAAALAGAIVGIVCTALIAPFLWHFKSSGTRVVERATRVAAALALFLASWFALEILIGWSSHWSNRGPRFYFAVRAACFLTFVAALCMSRTRGELVSSLDGVVGEKMTRRTAIATVGGTVALVVTEFALSKARVSAKTILGQPRPKSNFLLISFDALNAEDMSLYGCRLPTTPNIDAFGRKSTVFSNFYSASTFTTPSVATMLTGMYPSQTHVYQLSGNLRPEDTEKTLPHLMRGAGYATGAFLSNPLAYYLSKSVENEFDAMPEPNFEPASQPLWDATRPLHQDSGVGSRLDEYLDFEQVWRTVGGLPHNLWIRYRPDASFEHARQILASLPDGFFLWVHVLTPHDPYLPAAQEQGRFLPEAELQTFEKDGRRWQPTYAPDQQKQVDRRRLAYDEFLATADRAFGDFMAEMERNGRLRDTTVIVSADHGESFEGGVYQHQSAYQTRPVIHVPLIIKTPGQEDGRTVAVTADQTSLAPTILELAGVSKPDWMRGSSLVPWLNRNGQGDGEGVAFCQYFERNSVFRPLHHGTVGVIDGQYQYVVYLDDQKGVLRPLSEAQFWNLDRSSENPERAKALRDALNVRFPDLVRKTT
ncbi:MAG TPA: sulfatase [Candidatus Angelobacter sp.]|jgi:arylsulfatase A-like enzyme|nr:sulfatase [Candidatus Angelobacter sp.]